MNALSVAWLAALAAMTLLAWGANAQPAREGGAANGYRPPRTSWGDPDLEGKWPGTHMVGVPIQREASLGTRNVLNDEEFARRAAQFEHQRDADNADFDFANTANPPAGAVGGPVSPPPHWLERGDPQRQASLIVDPPNGRMPDLTASAQQREAELRAHRQQHPADSYADRSLYDRCITRGLAGSILPVIYNNGNQIFQSPGYVTIVNEMIHESRIVPLDGRARLSADIESYLGDPRGHWEGDTLVVETTNFTDRTGVSLNGGGIRNSKALKVTERFARVSDDTMLYTITIDDPDTWTAPFTMQYPLKRDDGYGMYEYACHEGNYALHNILSGARADERAAAKPAKP